MLADHVDKDLADCAQAQRVDRLMEKRCGHPIQTYQLDDAVEVQMNIGDYDRLFESLLSIEGFERQRSADGWSVTLHASMGTWELLFKQEGMA